MVWPGLPRPTACASRFSQPPDAFFRPAPAGPVSCRIRSWGFALQSFAPLAQPYAVSDACYPLDVRILDAGPPTPPRSFCRGEPRQRSTDEDPGGTPRASPPSGSCSVRESATRHRRFRPVRARGSPGLSPSRVLPLAGTARPSPRLPSWASHHRTYAAGGVTLQGFDSREIGLSLSRLPTLLGFAAS
jgi:hypothetical protein